MKSPIIKKRQLKTARKLTCYLPGLGHLYCGDFPKAILLMFGSLILTALTIIAWALDPPRTLAYLLLYLLSHIIVGIWAYLDIKKVTLRTREDYRLKDYNRPWVYAFFFLTYAFSVIPVAVFTVKTFVSNPLHIASDNSAPTIHKGDHVIASKIAYRTATPQIGDLIVFHKTFPKGANLVGRIIAKAGDTVEIQGNQILINGTPEKPSHQITQNSPLKDLKKITLSSSELFILGDNRDAAKDSRHLGPISTFSVSGKVNFRYWPLRKFGSLE